MKALCLIFCSIALLAMHMVFGISSVQAKPPNCSAVANNLASCNHNLNACLDDLELCVFQEVEMLPGDGYPNPDAFDVSGHGPALSYTDNLDGTFTDDNTQLMWEKKDDVDGFNIHDKDNVYYWSGYELGSYPHGELFVEFLRGLNNSCGGTGIGYCDTDGDCDTDEVCGFAGYQDWRIPNVKELQTLWNFSVSGPPISTIPGETGSELYWSSTTDQSASLRAWAVSFSTHVINPDVKNELRSARAVRP